MGAQEELRQAFQEIMDTREVARPSDHGLLGDGQGNLFVPGDSDDRVWFRKNGQASQLVKVYCWRTRPANNLPVICGYTSEQPRFYQVLTTDREKLEGNWQGMSDVARHAEMHIWRDVLGGDDPVMVWTRAMMPFRVSPQTAPNQTVRVEGPELFLWQTGWKEWTGQASYSLAAEIAALGAFQHYYCLISINGTAGTLQKVCSAAVAQTTPIPPTNYPAPPWGSVPLALVHLYTGQTRIVEDDIVDGRVIVSSAGGSVMPGVHDHSSAAQGGDDLYPERISMQTILVGPTNCPHNTLSAALAAITDAAANKIYVVLMMAGNFAEAANVTMKQYVYVVGHREGTYLNLAANAISMAANSGLFGFHATSTGGDIVDCNNVAGVVLGDMHLTAGGANTKCLDVRGTASVTIRNSVVDTTAQGYGLFVNNTATLLADHVDAGDANFHRGLHMEATACTATTLWCRFAGATNDVIVQATATWNHFACQFDPDNNAITGTENPLVTGRANYDDVVTFEDGITFDGASGANIITVPDNVASALYIRDAGDADDYITIVSTNGAREVVVNQDADADIDFRVEGVGAANALFVQGSDGFVGAGATVPDRQFHVEVSDAVTNAVTYAERLSHISTNVVVAGFGTGIEFELEENDATNRVAAIIEAKWSDAGETTNADGYLDFLTMLNDGAAASRMVVGYDGRVGIGTTTPPALLTVVRDTDATIASFQVDDGADTTSFQIYAYTNDYVNVYLRNTMMFYAPIDAPNMQFAAAAPTGTIRFHTTGATTDTTERMRITNTGAVGIGTLSPDRLLHAEVSDAVTNVITYAQRLSHTTAGGAAALFGTGMEMELEDGGGTMQVASELVTIWATATANNESPLLRMTTYPIGAAGPGYCGFWTWNDLDNNARTVVPNGAGDVPSGATIVYRLSESGGGVDGNVVMVNNGASVNLYDDGVDVCTLTVNADGSVTVVRSAGAATFDVAMFIVWL